MAKLALKVTVKMPKQKKASQTNKKKGGTVATKVKPAKNKNPKKFYVVQVSGMDGPTKYSSKAKALRGLQGRSRLEGLFGREDGARVMGLLAIHWTLALSQLFRISGLCFEP